MRRAALVLAYDGTDFAGWQLQPDDRTVQGELERGLTTVFGAGLRVVGASRTDAGVHARAQVAQVDLPDDAVDVERALTRGLNAILPRDVRVRGAALLDDSFHARKCSTGKRYRYRLRLARVDDPLTRRLRVHVPARVDLDLMSAALLRFVSRRDFASLQASGSSVKTTTRTVTLCELEGAAPEIDVVVEGDGFLRHMVRALVGSALEVARGRRPIEWIDEMLEARARDAAGPNVAARGLVLERVRYREPFQAVLDAATDDAAPARHDSTRDARHDSTRDARHDSTRDARHDPVHDSESSP